jgi:hypothetical protein
MYLGMSFEGHAIAMDDRKDTQDGDAQDSYLCAFDAEHSKLSVTL